MTLKKKPDFEKHGFIFPYALEWRITDSCNLKCKYCSEYKPEKPSIVHSSTVKKIIELAPKYIWIGGGEPALVNELSDIIKQIKEAINPHIGLSTNLTITEPVLKSLQYVDDLIVSLDTDDYDLSMNCRGVDPEQILENIKILVNEKIKKDLKVNITVNSVLYEDSLKNDGIIRLNDRLNKIDPGITQILSTVYPENNPLAFSDDSLIEKFNSIKSELNERNRNILINLPMPTSELPSGKTICYRRFFRVQLAENGEFFSPCRNADLYFPFCSSTCNCLEFIEDIFKAETEKTLEGSPFRGRLSENETRELYSFIKKYISKDVQPEHLNILLKK